MSKEELVGEINRIVLKLQELFGDEYNIDCKFKAAYTPQNIQNEEKTVKIEHHHHHHNDYNPWLFPVGYHNNERSQIVINNNSPNNNQVVEKKNNEIKKDEDDEEKRKKREQDEFTNKVIGTIIITGVTFAATILFSKDGFMTLQRSGLQDDLIQIERLSYQSGNYEQVQKSLEDCKKWIQLYEDRKKYPFYAKIGTVMGGIGLGAGLFLSAPAVVLGGVGVGTASGCYMIWNYFDRKNSINKSIEQETFNKVVNSLSNANSLLCSGQNFEYHPPQDNEQNPTYPDLNFNPSGGKVPSAPPY